MWITGFVMDQFDPNGGHWVVGRDNGDGTIDETAAENEEFSQYEDAEQRVKELNYD